MILDDIVTNKIKEIAASKRRLPIEEIKKLAGKQPRPLCFSETLSGSGLKLIAEVKGASPSKGLIRASFSPVEIATIYKENGASAISVLTDEKFFQGKIEYLSEVKHAVKIPILRKDFILEHYQVYESRAYSADAILLIVSILKLEKLEKFLNLSHSLGMDCLVEVHNKSELEVALSTGARIIGINNRDLTTMKTDVTTTERLRPLIPAGKVVISESGIKGRRDMERLEKLEINAALVGEVLMASDNIGGKVKELLGKS
jgi:indole-3-glycerol phosphate synthase